MGFRRGEGGKGDVFLPRDEVFGDLGSDTVDMDRLRVQECGFV